MGIPSGRSKQHKRDRNIPTNCLKAGWQFVNAVEVSEYQDHAALLFRIVKKNLRQAGLECSFFPKAFSTLPAGDQDFPRRGPPVCFYCCIHLWSSRRVLVDAGHRWPASEWSSKDKENRSFGPAEGWSPAGLETYLSFGTLTPVPWVWLLAGPGVGFGLDACCVAVTSNDFQGLVNHESDKT